MQIKNNNHGWFAAGVLVGAFCFGLASAFVASAFNGPGNNSAGNGNGSIAVDSTNDIAIGTSSAASGVRLLIMGSTTDSSAYTLEIQGSNGSPALYVRNDGGVSVGTSSVTAGQFTVQGNIVTTGNINTAVGAANITADTFGRLQGGGNYAFPGSLGVNTSSQVGLPQALSVYGSGLFTGGLTVAGLGSAGSPCVSVSAAGALATTTCGSGGVTGGVNNWIPLWTGASSLATSSLQQNGTTTFTQMGFAIGTSTIQPSGNLYVARGVTFAGLGSAGNPCVSVGATGILATSTCSGGSLSGGQSNYIPIWTNATTLGTSSLQQNGTTTFTLGGIAIGTSTAQNQGNIYITGNYLGGTISAGLVSSNAFGSGNFAFPGSLAVGTSNTALADALTVVGTTLLSGNATTTGAFSVGGNLSEQGSLLDVGGLLFATGAFVNVSNSTASTSLISATLANGTTTIPANVLRAGSIIHLKAFGLWNTTSTAQTATFWIKLGSNAIQSPNGPTTAGINNKGWIMQCDITIWSAGASGVWSPSCMFSGFAGGGAATPNQNYIDGSTSTIDTTSAAKLDVLWQWGSAFTTNSMTSTQVVAELEP